MDRPRNTAIIENYQDEEAQVVDDREGKCKDAQCIQALHRWLQTPVQQIQEHSSQYSCDDQQILIFKEADQRCVEREHQGQCSQRQTPAPQSEQDYSRYKSALQQNASRAPGAFLFCI